uniref:Uncharacterized protein n=1 Tax=Ananas comosus var. bracteatus TaxID=296719 RepID=A0A6V7NP64_ANACO|nr:unnamed protein product [Ananas comosus var. bracteatus]
MHQTARELSAPYAAAAPPAALRRLTWSAPEPRHLVHPSPAGPPAGIPPAANPSSPLTLRLGRCGQRVNAEGNLWTDRPRPQATAEIEKPLSGRFVANSSTECDLSSIFIRRCLGISCDVAKPSWQVTRVVSGFGNDGRSVVSAANVGYYRVLVAAVDSQLELGSGCSVPAVVRSDQTCTVTMPITRSQSAGADNAANFEEVETSAISDPARQRWPDRQTEAARRQEARMKRLEDLLLQQAAASRETQAPTPPAPVVDVAPRAPSPAPVLRVGACGRTPGGGFGGTPMQRPSVGAAFPTLVEGAERDRLLERLNEFRKCSPRVFDGEKVDHWIVGEVVDAHGKALPRHLRGGEGQGVARHSPLGRRGLPLVVEFLEHPSTDLAAITWTRFKKLSSGTTSQPASREDGAGFAQLAPRRPDRGVREGVLSASALRVLRRAGRRGQGPHLRARVAIVDLPVCAIL